MALRAARTRPHRTPSLGRGLQLGGAIAGNSARAPAWKRGDPHHMAAAQAPAYPLGVLCFGFTVPILLYRARLGWLLGHRFLLLTHRGWKTGKIRRTVLEVVHYDPTTRDSAVRLRRARRLVSKYPRPSSHSGANRQQPVCAALSPARRQRASRVSRCLPAEVSPRLSGCHALSGLRL